VPYFKVRSSLRGNKKGAAKKPEVISGKDGCASVRIIFRSIRILASRGHRVHRRTWDAWEQEKPLAQIGEPAAVRTAVRTLSLQVGSKAEPKGPHRRGDRRPAQGVGQRRMVEETVVRMMISPGYSERRGLVDQSGIGDYPGVVGLVEK
jgi:hypothetical protein